MDSQKFDGITRALASGTSRRSVLRGMFGTAFGGALATIGVRTAGASSHKVNVCHLTDDPANPVVLIDVSENAVPAHAAHGDATYVDLTSDVNNCGWCGNVCGAGEACEAGTCVSTCLADGEVCATGTECCGGACTNNVCGIPAACTLPVSGTGRNGEVGSGTAGTTQCQLADGTCSQTFQITLSGATPSKTFDVYIDQDSGGGAADHKFAGSFTTDASGNAFYANTINTGQLCPTVVDNEVVSTGASFTAHEYLQQSFAPCQSCTT
jgi:hypothetical protein